MNKKIKWAGVIFSLVPVLNAALAAVLSTMNVSASGMDYSHMLLLNTITHMITILIPAVVLIWLMKFNLSDDLQFRRTSVRNYILAFFIGASAIPAINVINYGYLILLKTMFHSLDMTANSQLSQSQTLPQLSLALLTVAIYPAISEELLFRGIIQASFIKKLKPFFAILLTSVLFGMFHMSITLLVGTTLIGALLGILAYKTKSIFPAMIAHFSNNLIALIVSFSLRSTTDGVQGGIPTLQEVFSEPGWLMGLIASFIMICISLLVVICLILLIKKPSGKNEVKGDLLPQSEKVKVTSFLTFLPGILVILLFYLGEAISYLMK